VANNINKHRASFNKHRASFNNSVEAHHQIDITCQHRRIESE
jgi:hypothetical protein